MDIECACSHRDAALCATGVGGIVSFYNLTVNKVGTHVLEYLHVELMPRSSSLDEFVREIYTVRDTSGFSILPGLADSLAVVDQPSSVYMGNVTGDEAAMLVPQPSCAYSDNSQNTIPIGDTGLVLGIPCFDNSDPNIDRIPPQYVNFCECHDEACLLRPSSLAAGRELGASTMSGNLLANFDSLGIAHFTDLSTNLARSDLRVACRFAEKDQDLAESIEAQNDATLAFVLTRILARSDMFTVFPGRLKRLLPTVGPGNTSGVGCARCPIGVHLQETALSAQVQMLDAADNELVHCTPTSRFCTGAPTTRLFVTLYNSSGTMVSNIPTGNLHGTTESQASQGKALFDNILIIASKQGYRLRFLAQATQFLPGGMRTSNFVIHADSDPFVVVNGPPSIITLVSNVGIATDLEVFVQQPVAAVRDLGGNVLSSDCYGDCGGRLTDHCGIVSTSVDIPECALRVRVSLFGASDPTRLLGTLTAASKQGLATFTDLSIDSGGATAHSNMCPSVGGCSLCHRDADNKCPPGECNLPPPYPDYRIQMSLEGYPGVPLQVSVLIQRRASNIFIVEQPADSVALELFANDISVKAVDCSGELLASSSALIVISIHDNAGVTAPGVLSGTISVPLHGGLAVFTDLSIQSSGKGYSLRVSYSGTGDVNSVFSASFDIVPAVTSLQLLASPSQGDPRAKAGKPFQVQPQVILKDADGGVVTISSASVTAALSDNPGMLQPWDRDQSFLAGTRVVEAISGRVTFTDLSLDKASVGQGLIQEGYSLTFILKGMRTTTNHFYVEASEWLGLFIEPVSQPVTATAGMSFPVNTRVLLVDGFKNKLLPAMVAAGTRVDVYLEQPQSRRGADTSSALVLNKNGCSVVCKGTKPTVCATCADKSLDATNGDVFFTDLRIDTTGQGYRLTFSSSGFNITSEEFDVRNTIPAYMQMTRQPSDGISELEINPADLPLSRQPIVSIHDIFGNLILLDADESIPVHIMHVELSTHGGLPSAAGFPNVPGQKNDTICRVSNEPLAGAKDMHALNAMATFTDLAVRPAMGGFRLLFLATTSIGILNVSSDEFLVRFSWLFSHFLCFSRSPFNPVHTC